MISEKLIKELDWERPFLILPGWIKSENDEQVHYIGYSQLIKLYDIPFNATCSKYKFHTRNFSKIILSPCNNYDKYETIKQEIKPIIDIWIQLMF